MRTLGTKQFAMPRKSTIQALAYILHLIYEILDIAMQYEILDIAMQYEILDIAMQDYSLPTLEKALKLSIMLLSVST